VSEFDPRLNFSHLLECLKGVLNLYDELSLVAAARDEMSAVYIMLNLGSPAAAMWASNAEENLR
jgi:hypothetical protein